MLMLEDSLMERLAGRDLELDLLASGSFSAWSLRFSRRRALLAWYWKELVSDDDLESGTWRVPRLGLASDEDESTLTG